MFCGRFNLIEFYARFNFFFHALSNAPCQFTPHLNLRSVIFGLTPFAWFICIYLSPLFPMRISFFIYAFLSCDHFSRNPTRA
jgi:hypothetical protein